MKEKAIILTSGGTLHSSVVTVLPEGVCLLSRGISCILHLFYLTSLPELYPIYFQYVRPIHTKL